LVAEEPEAILRFIVRLNEIYILGLGDDRSFVVRILPLVSGAVLRFFGDYLRNGRTWEQCKVELLREFFPHFVRERMVRDLITFDFHQQGQSVREYIDQVFTSSEFLGYNVGEQQLVDRVIMNLHPSILAQAAFLERPRSREELYNAVGLIEEKGSVLKERQRTQSAYVSPSGSGLLNHEPSRNVPTNSRPNKCWNCGRLGHVRRNCRQRDSIPGNGQVPGGHQTTGREH